jgi:hypothetical protein
MNRKLSPALAMLLLLPIVGTVHAADTMYIPASAAQVHADSATNNCELDLGAFFAASTASPDSCDLDFPISLPIGSTIDQIAIAHGVDDANFAVPSIEAWLQTTEVVSPYTGSTQFEKQAPAVVPKGEVALMRLMRQIPLSNHMYPDAFPVVEGTMYHVIVRLHDGATTQGLQISYQ